MDDKRQRIALLSGIALLSAALIGFELSLSNVFAVLLQYHYASVVISLAIFGIGVGALLSYRKGGRRARSGAAKARGAARGKRGRSADADKSREVQRADSDAANGSGAAAASSAANVSGAAAASGAPASAVARFARIAWLTGAAIAGMGIFISVFPLANQLALYALLAGIPFVLFGWALGLVLRELRGMTAQVYAADLLGAGLGVLLAMAVMDRWGGLTALLLFGLLTAAAGWAATLTAGLRLKAGRLRKAALAGLTPLVAFAAAALPADHGGLLALRPASFIGASPEKTLVGVLQNDEAAAIEYTRWDAFARTDVVATADPSRKMLFVDGGAGSYMYRFDGELSSVSFLMEDIEFLPFAISPIQSAAVIGAGGGRDVLYALLAGASDITAIEVSRGIVDSMRHYGEFNGHLADREGVRYVVGEGRHLLETGGDRYDAIVLDLVYSQVGGARNQTLSENFVFTEEAFRQYVGRLNEGGRIIVIAHHGLEGIRAYYTGFKAIMDTYGKAPADAAQHTALLLAPKNSKAPDLSVAVIARDPLAGGELQVLQAGAAAHGLNTLFLPGTQETLLEPLLKGTVTFDQFVQADEQYNVYPITDDRPFFFQIERGFPVPYAQWLVVNVLLTLLAVAVIRFSGLYGTAHAAGGAVPAVDKARLSEAGGAKPSASGGAKPSAAGGAKLSAFARSPLARLAYFALLGMGYMCVQTAVIQKSMLLFGSPVLSAAVVLFAMLLGGGAGSLIAAGGRVRGKPALLAAAGALAVFVAALYVVLPQLALLGQPLRIAAFGAVVFAVGVALGLPMPLGLKRTEAVRPGSSAFYFAVNGMASLWGAWVAVALSVAAGFLGVLLLGIVIYAAVAAIGWRGQPELEKGTARGSASVPHGR